MKNTFYVETYGCEMNKAESKALGNEMIKIGYKEVSDPTDSEWLIINTCTVRNNAEDRVIGRLGEFKRMKVADKSKKIALMGCVAERLKNNDEDRVLFDKYLVNEYIGSFDKANFIAKLAGKDIDTSSNEYEFFSSYGDKNDMRVYIPIMHGCNMFCSFCIVPYVRGREVSRKREDILAETKTHIANGVKEIIYLGQTVNNYKDEKGGFASLLKDIAMLEGEVRIKFSSSHPMFFSLDLIKVLASDKRFSAHIHLAAQHGSDRILADMNRHYTAKQFLDLLSLIRSHIPNASITTDLMVGYPDETDEDFASLLEFIHLAKFSDAFTYAYSQRDGTKASTKPNQIDEKTKINRIEKIINLQRSLTTEMLKTIVGKTLTVLVMHSAKDNGMVFGYSDENFNVIFKGDESLIGTFACVKIECSKGMTLIGNKIDRQQGIMEG